jgi:PDZ domain-containing protein
MTGSQRSAVAAALTKLGYAVRGDVRITSVQPGSAAAGTLKVGDVVRSYGGTSVEDACSLQDVVVGGGAKATPVVVERAGAERTVRVTPRLTDVGAEQKRPLLGVSTSASFTFPFTVDLKIADVGGPSAGMMFALGVIDKLTPGSLTGGTHVAGTGTICGDGTVGAIGGIVQKMAAARGAGAALFLAPKADCAEVVGHIPSGLDVVAVGTLSDALAALKIEREGGSHAGLARCRAQVGSAG